MYEKGRRGTFTFGAVFFPLAILVAMIVFVGGDVIAEDGRGPTPPPEGDWNITEDTEIDGGNHVIEGNVTVSDGVRLTVRDAGLLLNYTDTHELTFRLLGRSTLVIENSTLYLDTFEADEQSTLVFLEGTVVKSRGSFLARSHMVKARGATLVNTARDGGNDEDGRSAVFILNGSIDSECVNVTIANDAGDAGHTNPGVSGTSGGKAILISNISMWTDCAIGCFAGSSNSAILGFDGPYGRDGGHGSDAYVALRATHLERTTIDAKASYGGIGHRGIDNLAGDGGNGGSGNCGGDALILVVSDYLEMSDSTLRVESGDGGSGGRGGDAYGGDAGHGGQGADGGNASIMIHCSGEIIMEGVGLAAIAGEGGYGGDYGRNEVGNGRFGYPGPGGNGGRALVEVLGDKGLKARDLEVGSQGGAGLDGGGGYEQGERGGDGGEAELRVRAHTTLMGNWVYLNVTGGLGGDGGPSFAEIRGNGGDGGDALLEYVGLMEVRINFFSFHVTEGLGGIGNKPIYNGVDGIPTFDLETNELVAKDGEFNMPLDDLTGDARGYLYNVTFDMVSGILALPKVNAVVEVWFPVKVMGLDSVIYGDPHVGCEVTVICIQTGAIVAQNITDAKGECHFYLLAFTYTSQNVTYHGSYYFKITSPDGKSTATVRGEIQGPSTIVTIMNDPSPMVDIMIEEPVEGTEYRLFSDEDDHLEAYGYITSANLNTITNVYVQLVPEGDDPDAWPMYKMGLSPLPQEDVDDPEYKWGRYFPPDEHSNRWGFFHRFPIFGGDVEYYSGSWIFHVYVHTASTINEGIVSLDLVLDENIEKPWVLLHTNVDGETFDGSKVIIEGSAYDDHQLLLVEASIDGGDWEAIGTAEEWTYHLFTGALGEGGHTISFRAFDGRQYSDVNNNSFEVMFDDPSTNDDDGDGGPRWDQQTYMIAAGMVLLVIGIIVVLALVVMKVRSGPDS